MNERLLPDRRQILAGLGAAGLSGAAGAIPRSAGGRGPAGLPDARQLQEWTAFMANLGPRYAGNSHHRAYVDFLLGQFEGLGLKPKRDRVAFQGWNARRWSIEVEEGADRTEIEAAAYYPYSGETPEQGILAELVWLDGADPAGRSVSGKICVFRHRAGSPAQGADFSSSVLARSTGTVFDGRFGSSLVGGAASTPELTKLRESGAAGVIVIMDGFADLCLNGVYAPFFRPHQGIPALLISARAGEALKRHRAARLTLVAERTTTYADHLSADILGRSPQTIALLSHSDGPNAFQENGSVGILALAHQLASIPPSQRPRTVTVACVEGHLAPHEGRDVDGWLEANPELRSRIIAAMAIEHLGATEWTAQGREAHRTGGADQGILSVSDPRALQAVALEAFKRADLRNALCIEPLPGPRGTVLPGLANFTHAARIPTVGYITIPPYLLSAIPDHHLGKFSAQRMRDEIGLLSDILTSMTHISL